MKRIIIWIAVFLTSAAACHGIFLKIGFFTGEFSGLYIMVAGCTAFTASIILFRSILFIGSKCTSGRSEGSRKTRIHRQWTGATMEQVDFLDGIEFEDWCAGLLIENGYTNVMGTPASGDQGVDILAEKEGVKFAFQCKCYSSDLGNTPVQEVYAGKTMYDCHVGIVMTNRHFTSGAVSLADKIGVLLWDREKLESMICGNVLLGENEKKVSQNGFCFV